jgi:hypothetical protein
MNLVIQFKFKNKGWEPMGVSKETEEIKEVKEVRDWHSWKRLFFFIEFAKMQDDITVEMYETLREDLLRFKPIYDE